MTYHSEYNHLKAILIYNIKDKIINSKWINYNYLCEDYFRDKSFISQSLSELTHLMYKTNIKLN